MATRKATTKAAAKKAPAKKAAKKAAAKKPSKKTARPEPPRLTEALRGAALVERVIEAVRANACWIEVFEPRPVAEAEIAELTFAGGAPLPPSLKQWLAFDASWLTRQYPHFGTPGDLIFPLKGWKALIDATIGGGFWGKVYFHLRDTPVAGRGVELDCGSDSMRFLFVGKQDAHSEYPVLWADVDDMPCLGIEAPGFDVWLAQEAGMLQREDIARLYAADLKAQSDLNLGGAEFVELRGPWTGLRANKKVWAGPMADFEEDVEDEAEAPAAPKKQKPKAAPVVAEKPVPKMAVDKLAGALVEAIDAGDPARFERFLAAAQAQHPNAVGWKNRGLAAAVEGRDLALIDRMIELGANVNAESTYSWRMLGTAARRGFADVVERLCARGADLEILQGAGEHTALCDAADQKHLDCVKVLLARGANPNAPDSNGMAPLHHAAHHFDEDRARMRPCVEALLDGGAKIDLQDGNQRTALHWAIDERSADVAELLIARGANLDLRNWANETAALMAWKSGQDDVLARLAAGGCRWDLRDKDGLTLEGTVDRATLLPKVFEVAYECLEAPQDVAVEVEWVVVGQSAQRAGGLFPKLLADGVDRLVETVGRGAWGGATFAPTAGVAKRVTAPMIDPRKELKARYQFAWTLRLGGVSPEGLAQLLDHLRNPGLGARCAALRLRGDRPLVGGERSVDTARAAAWAAKHPALPAWPEPGFPIERAALDKEAGFTVVFEDNDLGLKRIQELVGDFAAHPLVDAMPRAPIGRLLVAKAKGTKKAVEVTIKNQVPGANAFPEAHEVDATAALLTNLLARIHGHGATIISATLRL
jgi:hypothetical protein